MTPEKTTPRKGGPARRAVLAGALALTLSAGGATASALDRFVVEHVQISDGAAYEASQGVTSGASDTAHTAATAARTTDTSYTSADSSISISTVVTGSGDSTVTYYVADVVL